MKTTFTGFILSLFTIGILCISASSIKAATFVVNDFNDVVDAAAGDGICATSGAVCTLRAAITEANALAGADVITLPAGTYTIGIAEASDNANANGDFDITSDIAINGAGSASTFVEANVASGVAIGRVFHIRGLAAANTIIATLDGLTVRNGRYPNNTFGAGIRIDQGTNHNVTLSNLIVSGNLNSTSGGGISISGATTPTITISNSTITGNGAGSAVTGTGANGAGLHVNTIATVNISNSTISNNASNNAIATSTASIFGGGVFIGGGTTTITNSTISGNSVAITGAGSTGASFAGGIYNQQAILNITDSNVINNTASNSITPASSFHAAIRTLAGTIAATTTITNCTISGNTAGGDGGGVVNIPTSTLNSTTNIIGSTIFGNTSTAGAGGGVLNSSGSTTATSVGAVNITNSTIRNNNAVFGAGIMNQISGSTGVGAATTTLTGSTVNGNVATGNGGGIYNISFATATGTATINSTNSTISGNRGSNGGGITNENGAAAVGATSNLNFSTVASNTATTSGGGLNQGGVGSTINLKNSIVADNSATTSGPDIFGTITSQDYNHVEDITGGVFFASSARKGKETLSFFALPNDVTGSDPLLGVLANNGGTTLTHLPAIASPVANTIPSGASDCGILVTTSQNAVTRPQGVGCEKGGAERSAPSAATAAVRGRLVSTFNRSLANANVSITNTATGEVRYSRSNQLGYFNFQELEVGNIYVIEVNSKRFRFENHTFTLNEDLTDLVLTAQ